ncbi:phosphoglucomutase/phosphomannomutase family protein [Aestuariimicrobium sp. T2.26MG-19.2B]|uniref:phosphoglucomutase/phosphomannomutase family protein n=1 Tax=Aestuariimicrobium sp. T2.26MG-19.2B TaxID=3040679 RepID=UPI0024776443|nr:phosphoglucomutase/phosphomannomutase family protein [Aestuariimicrobium sp. T2.26MG-19.2B]CAI9399764.1 Phosphoglucomutase [Aestuariimicrobium sp. T2.26MG-19.2B]
MIEFGTGGWRAIIADGFTRENVRLLSQGLADRAWREHPGGRDAAQPPVIAMGYDRRFLSREATYWAAEVLAGNGVQCHLIDRSAPTPLVMFTTRELDCAYGMAVTASHNPALYNGIKVFTRGGRDADADTTAELQDEINALTHDDVSSVATEVGVERGLIRVSTSFNDYIDAIIEQVDMQAIRDSALSIILDPMFGVARTCLETILVTARCQLEVINDRRDTLFGGKLPSPNVDTLRVLRQTVLDRGADLGIGTDGDADRLGIIDDRGNFLHPNQILVLLYHYLLTVKGWKGPVVRNLATTHLLDRVAAAHGEECFEVPVGFKHISAGMEAHGAIIGGESSGGLTVRGHIPGKDGIYAASLLVEAIAVSGKKLSELYADIVDEYGRLEMVETDFAFSDARKTELVAQLMQAHDLPPFGAAVEKVSWLDGCKVRFTNGGWVVIRFSGTEPVLRVFAEMPTLDEAQAVVDEVTAYYRLG